MYWLAILKPVELSKSRELSSETFGCEHNIRKQRGNTTERRIKPNVSDDSSVLVWP